MLSPGVDKAFLYDTVQRRMRERPAEEEMGKPTLKKQRKKRVAARLVSRSTATRRNGDNLNGDKCGHRGDRMSRNCINESLYIRGLKKKLV